MIRIVLIAVYSLFDFFSGFELLHSLLERLPCWHGRVGYVIFFVVAGSLLALVVCLNVMVL
ncbi:MAG: hypothetical protein H3C30_11050 [Candidatus Hydrogenedentes bacterium]|nr:hypothetical protein [Candidatus Hydrogenedentota bacterium]